MPEFQLDTSGSIATGFKAELPGMHGVTLWRDLDTFTQGYIEALFFTEGEEPGVMIIDGEAQSLNVGFADLAPETLAAIIADCAKFQAATTQIDGGPLEPICQSFAERDAEMRRAGHDFWLTRNGHGAGFWDGDWPEPYATALDEAAKAFDNVDVYLGDDGKVYV